MMKCTACGAELTGEKLKFCPECGKPVVGGMPCKVWPEWELDAKPIGRGAYGTVYKATRRDSHVESYAAIKLISIPTDLGELEILRSEGMTADATKSYLQQMVNDFVGEIQLMESLKGVTNVVNVEDYQVVEKADEIGWDIYIRMELLTPFPTYAASKTLTEKEVIKLGSAICTALEICDKCKIIHRDIKPENIFINDFGHFKLGDFGIARKMENLTGGLSQKGTFNYMAPEVANSNTYDARVDTYSLGIVLYRLLNENRLPFLFGEQQVINPNERRMAVERRLRGEELPAPCKASAEMADVILRACAFHPDERFASAAEMKKALHRVANGTYVIAGTNAAYEAVMGQKPEDPASVGGDQTVTVRKPTGTALPEQKALVQSEGAESKPEGNEQQKQRRSLKGWTLGLVAAAVLLAVLVGVLILPKLMGADGGKWKINGIIRRAEEFAKAGNYQQALDEINEGLGDYPDSAELQTHASAYESSLNKQKKDNLLRQAQQLADAGDYIAASALIMQAIEEFPSDLDYSAALQKYGAGEVQQVKQKALADAKTYADKGDYASAAAVMQEAREKYPEDTRFDTAYKVYLEKYNAGIRESAVENAKSCAGRGDYQSAMKVLKNAEAQIGEDSELQNLVDSYMDAYLDEVMSKADGQVALQQYEDAKKTLEEALEITPDNQILQSKLEDVQQLWVPADDLKPISGAFNWQFTNDVKDYDGNSYRNALNCAVCHGKNGNHEASFSSVEYEVNQGYNRLAFSYAPASDFGYDGAAYIRVYVNGVHRYTSPWITRSAGQNSVSLDICDANRVKIEIITSDNGCLLLSDMIFSYIPQHDCTKSNLVSLSAVEPSIDRFAWENSYPFDKSGTDYSYAANYYIGCSKPKEEEFESVVYRLNKQYSYISFSYAPEINFKAGSTAKVHLLLDGKEVFQDEITANSSRKSSGNIYVGNATRMELVLCYDDSWIVLSDVVLTPA